MATDNVVIIDINELLYFYINRMDVLPRSILNRTILDNFNDEDILSAKDTVHSHVSTTLKHRRIKQGVDKAKHNVEDISKVLDEVDPDAIPIYVARDLGKLPTVDFNYVDMSTLSREITTCKSKLYNTELFHQTLDDSVSELSTQIFTLVSLLLHVTFFTERDASCNDFSFYIFTNTCHMQDVSEICRFYFFKSSICCQDKCSVFYFFTICCVEHGYYFFTIRCVDLFNYFFTNCCIDLSNYFTICCVYLCNYFFTIRCIDLCNYFFTIRCIDLSNYFFTIRCVDLSNYFFTIRCVDLCNYFFTIRCVDLCNYFFTIRCVDLCNYFFMIRCVDLCNYFFSIRCVDLSIYFFTIRCVDLCNYFFTICCVDLCNYL